MSKQEGVVMTAEQRAVWIGERLFDRWLEKWKYAGGVFAAMQLSSQTRGGIGYYPPYSL